MFSRLMPREGRFFEYFDAVAVKVVDGARELAALMGDIDQLPSRRRRIETLEKEADVLTHATLELLHKTFITPIDREQIHGLINAMDDILDLLQDASETMTLYDVQAMNDDIVRLGDLSAKCCERVQHAVSLLPHISTPDVAQAALRAKDDRHHLDAADRRQLRQAGRAFAAAVGDLVLLHRDRARHAVRRLADREDDGPEDHQAEAGRRVLRRDRRRDHALPRDRARHPRVDDAHDHRRDRRRRLGAAGGSGALGRRRQHRLGVDLHDPGLRIRRRDRLFDQLRALQLTPARDSK